MRLEPNRAVGQCYISSWYFGCESDGDPYGIAVAYSSDPWGDELVSWCYREYWV
jgi:hypothetical protein